jgi:hypothetical protein
MLFFLRFANRAFVIVHDNDDFDHVHMRMRLKRKDALAALSAAEIPGIWQIQQGACPWPLSF